LLFVSYSQVTARDDLDSCGWTSARVDRVGLTGACRPARVEATNGISLFVAAPDGQRGYALLLEHSPGNVGDTGPQSFIRRTRAVSDRGSRPPVTLL
jgi:hypothetical protein